MRWDYPNDDREREKANRLALPSDKTTSAALKSSYLEMTALGEKITSVHQIYLELSIKC